MYLALEIDKVRRVILVHDTEDKSDDYISFDDAIVLCDTGTVIYGVTSLYLIYGSRVTVYLRLYNNGIIRDFDGRRLFKYDEDSEGSLSVQVIDSAGMSLDELMRYSTLLQNWNIKESVNPIIRYDAVLNRESGFVLRDKFTGNIYQECDYCVCMNLLYSDHEGIEGAVYGDTEITVKDWKVSLRDVLKQYANSKKALPTSSTDSIHITDSILDSMFENSSVIFYDDTYPLVNMHSYIRKCSGEQDAWFTQADIVMDSDLRSVHFESGLSIGYDKFKKIARVARYDNEAIESQTTRYLKGYEEKAYMLGVDGSCIASHRLRREDNVIYQVGAAAPGMEIYLFTPLGSLSIAKSRTLPSGVWLVRFTHVGSVYYDFSKVNGLTLGTMTNFKGVSNDSFSALVNKCILEGKTYYHDLILPLCFGGVYHKNMELQITVLCLLAGSGSGFEITGTVMMEVPLLWCGGRFEEYDNCYVFRTAYDDITFDKQLLRYLHADTDIIDYGNFAVNLNKLRSGNKFSIPGYFRQSIKNTRG